MSLAPTCSCGAAMVLRESRFGKFYGCTRYPECKIAVGAHASDNRPMAIPMGPAASKARQDAHAAFDAIWQNALAVYDRPFTREYERKKAIGLARRRTYEWLSVQMGLTRDDCHIGYFGVEECQRVVAICSAATYADVRAWAKSQSREVATS